MRTEIPDATLATDRGNRANAILRTCVHCGMCNATCPTYQVRGDELDGPRGRIYLIKGLLESGEANAVARTHLDRCLTCRACETTCPSGVRYGELAEIGREVLEEQRPSRSLLRLLLLGIVPKPGLLAPLVAMARPFRRLLPRRLRRLLEPPPRHRPLPARGRVLLMQGCVQRVVTPEVNAHLAGLLQARDMAPFVSDAEECCGGLALHAGRTAAARSIMRRNVAQLPVDDVDVIISTASGCGVTLKDYRRVLGDEAATRFADKVRDVAEALAGFDFQKNAVHGREVGTVAWHPPCTLQHGQRVTGLVEKILTSTGYQLVPVADQHLCCGSAGSYSLLQPDMATELKERKTAALTRHNPDVIATANIGCQTHLADAVGVPVVHWLELLR
ncbi:MAG: glycolate oxidase subunit GlcF [Pseudomonadales bacterium]|nr:glycolate oxidase subunit GlcF [Pseudomonadales bacterium]